MRGAATGASGLASGAATGVSGLASGAAGLAAPPFNFIVDTLARAAPPLSDIDDYQPTFYRPSAPPASVIDDLAARRAVFGDVWNAITNERAPVERIFLTEVPEPLIPEGETPLPEGTILDLMTRPAASTIVPEPLALYPEGEDLLAPPTSEALLEPEEEDELFVDASDEEPIVVEVVDEYISPELPLDEEPLRVETAATLAGGGGAIDTPQVSSDLVRRKQSAKESAADLKEKFGDFTQYEEAAIDAGYLKGAKADVLGYLRKLSEDDREATQFEKLKAASSSVSASDLAAAEYEPPTFTFLG